MAQPTKTKNSAGQRKFFTTVAENAELPNLIDHQLKSFDWFVQEGLQEIFQEVNPIEDYTGTKLELRFKDYRFEDPKMSEADARENNVSYEAPLKAVVELTNKVTGEVKEQEIYLGDYPWMTNRGTFVINGAERVVVSFSLAKWWAYVDDMVQKLFQAVALGLNLKQLLTARLM